MVSPISPSPLGNGTLCIWVAAKRQVREHSKTHSKWTNTRGPTGWCHCNLTNEFRDLMVSLPRTRHTYSLVADNKCSSLCCECIPHCFFFCHQATPPQMGNSVTRTCQENLWPKAKPTQTVASGSIQPQLNRSNSSDKLYVSTQPKGYDMQAKNGSHSPCQGSCGGQLRWKEWSHLSTYHIRM